MSDPTSKLRVLIVCSGNTCRSPMAEAALLAMLPPALRDRIDVDSAGAFTTGGEPMSIEARVALDRAGIDSRARFSRALTTELVRDSDLILVMEPHHRAAVIELSPGKADVTHLLDAFASATGDDAVGIRDPIGGTEEAYTACLERIQEHLEPVVEYLSTRVPGVTR